MMTAGIFMTAGAADHSSLVCPGNGGRLEYKAYTDKGDIIPDFSQCGYMGGGVAIPNVPVVLSLEPGTSGADDHPRIQEAIDQIGKMPADPKGFKGALLLKKGVYKIGNTLKISSGGIVLRGEGSGEDGTVLIATQRKQHTLISISGTGQWEEVPGSRTPITDDYVPVGARSFNVADASKFKVGDKVIVHRPSTKEWIEFLGMDKIASNWMPVDKELKNGRTLDDLRKEGLKISPDGKKFDNTRQWTPGSKDLRSDRTITAIRGNLITLDVPIVNALQNKYGGGAVYKYEFPGRIEQAGVEHVRGVSEFDPAAGKRIVSPSWTEYFDEKHASNFISLESVRNAWVSDVTSQYFFYSCVNIGRTAIAVTVQDCSGLDGVSGITGGRRYVFNVAGQLSLVQRCYARRGRHDFVLSALTVGPNVFLDCKAEESWCTSEPHHRWSAGCLWDNVSVEGPNGWMGSMNRGNSGSGHGWSGAQMVFWNCRSAIVIVQQPPTAQNFAIGSSGKVSNEWSDKNYEGAISWVKGVSRNPNPASIRSGQLAGDAHVEHGEGPVEPRSLYLAQLKDRLGEQEVKNISGK